MREEQKKSPRSKFMRHVAMLMWKTSIQRQRQWRQLACEIIFAFGLFLLSVIISKPVFMTPLEAQAVRVLYAEDLYASVQNDTYLGFAPSQFNNIMERVAVMLKMNLMSAPSEKDLNLLLYNEAKGTPIKRPVIWVIWKNKRDNVWSFSIRCTARAIAEISTEESRATDEYLNSGFLGVQMAVSQAILEVSSLIEPNYEMRLMTMPVSPLMQEGLVMRSLSWILLCFTIALMPPVLDTVALVVRETNKKFKRGLRMRDVDYSSLYLGWLFYAYQTVFPICLLGTVCIIFIFRWIRLTAAVFMMFLYFSVMLMQALLTSMFHSKVWSACVWTVLFSLLQTFLAQLLVHHRFDQKFTAVSFVFHMVLPPLGLVHGFNEFALIQTGQRHGASPHPLSYTMTSWAILLIFYYGLLMLLQRTISNDRAIGGQVSWTSIIFKKAADMNRLRRIENPTGNERDHLQEVDELTAKAISFDRVSKTIMDKLVLSNVTFDIYRGETTCLFADRVQHQMIVCIEDLLTGLTYPDKGKINILGEFPSPSTNLMDMPYMIGYCHRCDFLIDDLTVQEHLLLFIEICLWNESSDYVDEYGQLRLKHLLQECKLENVKDQRAKHLDNYYKAQLCWAIAIVMEPKIIFMPNYIDSPSFTDVLTDKIMLYTGYITIVKFSLSSIKFETSDRVFIFDRKRLAFGGTPAYLYFKYGHEYRIRISFRSGTNLDDHDLSELLEMVESAGASVRAHLGSLMILRMPTAPTKDVAALIRILTENSAKFSITSMNVTLPDSSEVCHRAVNDLRRDLGDEDHHSHPISRQVLKKIAETHVWHKTKAVYGNCMIVQQFGWKFFQFYHYYKSYFFITIASALVAGVFIGISLSDILLKLGEERDERSLSGDILTVEALEPTTTLVLTVGNSSEARSIANGYVLSETNATAKQVAEITYLALSETESLSEYLATRAIDSPQQYVYLYAYGLQVVNKDGSLRVQVRYSPLHHDHAAAARSLARAYMALIRHYSAQLDASIEVTDDPLVLDLTPWIKHAMIPPLFIQFLLILTISHVTLIPSKEYGLIRHVQSNAFNCSPAIYWLSLYWWDVILYGMLVALMTVMMYTMMYLSVPWTYFDPFDLLVVPLMLMLYGIACVPQAYLFSLGSRAALNTMVFVIVNVVFGETTVLAKLFYENFLNYVLNFLVLSPQFNMAYAFVKIKQIFVHNSECRIFKTQNLCIKKSLHKCCDKCGVMQECFKRQSYFSRNPGILIELIAIIAIAIIYTVLLLLWEYKHIQRWWKHFQLFFNFSEKIPMETLSPGLQKEVAAIMAKKKQILTKERTRIDTFGDCILSDDISRYKHGEYRVRNISFGVGRGEALAISGLKRHGRIELCKVIAGYKLPDSGHVWSMSKWDLRKDTYLYASKISLSCELRSVPPWMTVKNALGLIAVLRGVPSKHAKEEIEDFMLALDLMHVAKTLVYDLDKIVMTRLCFAAAVVGAPPVIILDEYTAYQKASIKRTMFYILYNLRRQGHAIIVSSTNVESHLPLTNRLAILLDGTLVDINNIDKWLESYGKIGYTVVLHLKDDLNVKSMFRRYFRKFVINDVTDVLVNVQVLDKLSWDEMFTKLEMLQKDYQKVYSYVVTATPIDYVYNAILASEKGHRKVTDTFRNRYLKFLDRTPKYAPDPEEVEQLMPFENKYDITNLNRLPWSVIFQR